MFNSRARQEGEQQHRQEQREQIEKQLKQIGQEEKAMLQEAIHWYVGLFLRQ